MYSREIDSQKLSLRASGWTYKNTFVLYDRQTESMWYHLEGTDGLTCVSGKYQDQKLKEFQSVFGRWNEWVADNPDTKYLRYNPGAENDD